MKKSSLYIVLLVLLTTANACAQKTTDKNNYTAQVQAEEGDLNNDTYNDKVVVEMDVKDETRPLRVQIFLSQPNKKLQLAVSSTKIIESQYPAHKKGNHNGNNIPDFIIEDGNLKILTDINDRKSIYEFRLKQNNFELIKISHVSWDGKNTTSESEIDLLAQTQVDFQRDLGSAKISNKKTKKIKVNALPKIQDLSFADLERY
ncbi:hypothetical protein QWZ06_16615 [Chryseobacterium tructae]|uniref:Lipoprotein n=1 Tax=Chryseobacterium tructae TaxID=1037380 RepID=A0ABV7XYJ2_9FLAO|nr:hypothetical protein [Chryseobacterium tructae]MDN3693799.1 hypothetical protein [Chryseobacterium tructae]